MVFLRLRILLELELDRFFCNFFNKFCVQHGDLYYRRVSGTKICISEEWLDPYPPLKAKRPIA